MNDQTIKTIVEELAPALAGKSVGKVFQLSRLSVAIDFRLRDGRLLFLSAEPQPAPRLYLIKRRVRDLEKQSLPATSFVMSLYKRLSGARLVAIEKEANDRIVRLSFAASDIAGNILKFTLIAQLTGRAANLLLLDESGYVIDSLRSLRGQGLEGGNRYEPPVAATARSTTAPALEKGHFDSLSEAADAYYLEIEADRQFTSRIAVARARLKKEIGQRKKLRRHLEEDIAAHGDAETHKRIGELLLANIGTAERCGTTVTVTDYYAEGTPRIEFEIDENASLKEEATRRFTRYTKARRASGEIARRLDEIESELLSLNTQQAELERIISEHDREAVEGLIIDDKKRSTRSSSPKQPPANISGARRYLSSDGFEILVGRAARDNDHLTFHVARPHDLWLHAADYPGSHVIVLNPTRKEIPHRTVIEAAQLAAKFSHARRDGKVDVHYTQRKYLAKPKGAAPGLVRMSSFRTIIVEPRDTVERI